jgi:hypothetical protein
MPYALFHHICCFLAAHVGSQGGSMPTLTGLQQFLQVHCSAVQHPEICTWCEHKLQPF